MDIDRNALKVKLYHERGRCDVCGRPVPLGCQMHESIVRKGQAQGWALEDRGLINVEENCHLVCSEACHREAHANPRLMTAIMIVRYGKVRIQRWIDSLPFRVPYYWDRGMTAVEARLRVEASRSKWILEE